MPLQQLPGDRFQLDEDGRIGQPVCVLRCWAVDAAAHVDSQIVADAKVIRVA